MRAVILSIAACAACGTSARPTPTAPSAPEFELVGPATLVAPDVVSSEYSEIRLAVSPDGALRLWGSTDRPGGPGGWDLWMSRRGDDGAWGAPTAVSFGSEANDFDPAFSPDGAWVYFFSNRPGGAGGDDLYRAAVTADGFGPATWLGPIVNGPGDEWAPAPAPDGSGLLFATNAPGGKHALVFAPAQGDGFGPPVPLPGAINQVDSDEFDATFVGDLDTLVFSRSTDVEEAPIALYVAHRGPDGWDAGVALPTTVNVDGGYTLGPAVDPQAATLYFSSHRAEAGRGKLDIFAIGVRTGR